jgi:hypothetical protein
MISSKEVDLFLTWHPNKNDFVLKMFVESVLTMNKQNESDEEPVDSLSHHQPSIAGKDSVQTS